MTEGTACYAFEGAHYLRNRHLDGCEAECDGCQGCTLGHCPH